MKGGFTMAYNLPSRASQLLRQLSAADFYAQDLKLFLDTHPDDEKALELYRAAVKQTEACRCALRASCAGKDCGWDWLSGQWIL